MNIGEYSFKEFCTLAEKFHGYAAPGVLVGGYMVIKAKKALQPGTLFEAVVESSKCLPDAVQLLTLCSIGNQRLKILDLGRYAVNLFDKHTGNGFRVSLNPQKMKQWPELYAWFFKKKPKHEQNALLLEREIEESGDGYCDIIPITIKANYLGHGHSQAIGICPGCGEAYPLENGDFCRGCQGLAPYSTHMDEFLLEASAKQTQIVPVEEAIGKIISHDMTRIEPGKLKRAEFKKGHLVTPGDICRLQSMGRFHIAVQGLDEEASAGIHENICAEAFAQKMAGTGIKYSLPPSEGKIDFLAQREGLFYVNKINLLRFNNIPMVMAACINNYSMVKENDRLAGTRAIPLFLPKNIFEQAIQVLDDGPLFHLFSLRKANVGILVTGTEIFQGLIQDKFIPVISSKMKKLNCNIVRKVIVPDEKKAIYEAIEEMKTAGIDFLITTGGLSVDPDDVTRDALLNCGLTDIVHGIPVLPGTMSLIGKIKDKINNNIDVVGVPACALYYKTTLFDLIVPRILAGLPFTRMDASNLSEGGYCQSCFKCAWPKCGFGK